LFARVRGQRQVGKQAVTKRPLIYLLIEGRFDNAVKSVHANGGKALQEKQQIGRMVFAS